MRNDATVREGEPAINELAGMLSPLRWRRRPFDFSERQQRTPLASIMDTPRAVGDIMMQRITPPRLDVLRVIVLLPVAQVQALTGLRRL